MKKHTGILLYVYLNKSLNRLFFRHGYDLVLYKHGGLLYSGLGDTIGQHLAESSAPLSDVGNENILSAVSQIWDKFQLSLPRIRDVMLYVENNYVVNNSIPGVNELGLNLFRTVVLCNSRTKLFERVRSQLLLDIQKERRGQVIDRETMKNVLSMLVTLSIHEEKNFYVTEFEDGFLGETRVYYEQESLGKISTLPCSEYLMFAESQLFEEGRRIVHYIPHATEEKLKLLMSGVLIANHAHLIIKMELNGLDFMFHNNSVTDLRRLFSLFQLKQATGSCFVDLLRDALFNYVKDLGNGLIITCSNSLSSSSGEGASVVFVNDLLALKSKFESIILKAWNRDKIAMRRLKEALEHFMNQDYRCIQYLVSYCDEHMKSLLKNKTEDESESVIEDVIMLFRLLHDKDIFENYYKRSLARRLLSSKSISDEYERSLLTKLKMECGHQYTSHMEGMFTDMALSKSTMDLFSPAESQSRCASLLSLASSVSCGSLDGSSANGNSSMTPALASQSPQISVLTLTAGFWPFPLTEPCCLPSCIVNQCDRYTDFYCTMYSGRKLAWQTHLGSAEVRAFFGLSRMSSSSSGTSSLPVGVHKDLSVSTYQMTILMLFSASSNISLTLSQIRERCGIPDMIELNRHLLSLCTSKIRILLKSSKGKVSVIVLMSFVVNDKYVIVGIE